MSTKAIGIRLESGYNNPKDCNDISEIKLKFDSYCQNPTWVAKADVYDHRNDKDETRKVIYLPIRIFLL
ncbi:MAG: hypothetical protein LKE40_13030 [Spirochaetia bacterium]|jgi:hypothetical protein|nr:hypothetical protein [Spirochaetia bacterium]